MQQRKPDILIILALFVGLGVVVTTTVHGAETIPIAAPLSAEGITSDTWPFSAALSVPGEPGKKVAGVDA